MILSWKTFSLGIIAYNNVISLNPLITMQNKELDFIEVQIRDKMREKQRTRISHSQSVSRKVG